MPGRGIKNGYVLVGRGRGKPRFYRICYKPYILKPLTVYSPTVALSPSCSGGVASHVLRSSLTLEVKEGQLALLWLLATSSLRLSMGGGSSGGSEPSNRPPSHHEFSPVWLSLGRGLSLTVVLLAGLWLKQDESVQEVCF